MAGRVAALWRHPIKGCGVEAVERATLAAGTTMPWDRVWAVAHDAARVSRDGEAWAECVNFARGARTAALMAVRAAVDEATGVVRLSHPARPSIAVDPDRAEDAARLVAWLDPLCDPARARPAFVVRAAGRGMTDSDFPSISVLGAASLRALGQKVGRPLAMERFRGNLWVEGLGPWEEFEWVGREIRAGAAVLRVRERITRCAATTVDPATGVADADTLGALEDGWGHRDFGVYAEVVEGGAVAVGDAAGRA